MNKLIDLSRPYTHRLLLGLTGLYLLFIGFQVWVYSTTTPLTNWVSTCVIFIGILISVLSFKLSSDDKLQTLEWLTMAAFVLVFAARVYSVVQSNPAYGTDELAFDQYAAEKLLHGINPYTIDMEPSLTLFQVPAIFHTYTITGGEVNVLSYPSLSFLLYIPFMIFGLYTQAAVIVNAVFWIITVVMLYMLLPRPYKMLAIVFGCNFTYDGYVIGGVTDVLFMPFMLLAAWKWDLFGKPGVKGTWIGPVSLGLAASVKQTAWFIAPFIALGIWTETKSIRQTAKYIGWSAMSFLAVNIPFVIWGPKQWLNGVFSPFLSKNIPSGLGLINLTMIQNLGGGHLQFYTIGAILLIAALLFSQYRHYAMFKGVIFLIASLVLFFPARSLGAYLIDLFPFATLAFLTVKPYVCTTIPKPRLWVTLAAFAPAAIVMVLAVTLPAPLELVIHSVRTTGSLGTIEEMQVSVKNRSSHPVTPYFTITMSPQVTTFWIEKDGLQVVKPGETRLITLDAPNVSSMPSITGGFLLDAFTENPTALSTSKIYRPVIWKTYITPESVNRTIPLHHPIQLTVQLLDRYGQPVKKAHVPVSLSQVVYSQVGMVPGESSINHRNEGQSPVMEYTNKDGVVNFTVIGLQPQDNPIYYQAYIQPNSSYPYAYSEIVAVRFR